MAKKKKKMRYSVSELESWTVVFETDDINELKGWLDKNGTPAMKTAPRYDVSADGGFTQDELRILGFVSSSMGHVPSMN